MRLDVLFVNGRFATLDPARPAATRLGVFAGRIVGLDEDLDGLTAEAVVDLGGAPVVPGFNDAHHHLSMRGQRLRELDLRDGRVRTLEELYAKVAERAAGLPRDAWVKGAGYDQNKLGGLHPSREALDRAAGGRPVWLQHVSGHMGVANTAAFARMGFDRVEDVPDVAGGTVGRDADGRPDGLLAEQAQGLADAVLRPVPFEDFVEGIALAGRVAAGEGLTSFTEPGIGRGLAGNGAWDLAAFQEAVRRGVLPQRATLMPGSPNLHDIGDGWFGLDLGFRTGIGDERLRIGPVKLFSDGSLIGRTAAMCCDYEGEPGNRGLLQQDAEALRAFILRAHAAGWQIATHAIGDHAVDVVLDAYEEAQARDPRPDARHRIEHCAVTSDAQVARIARLGVIPVPQGRFVSELGDGMLAALGPERSLGCYRQRSFLEAGIVVPGSSDCPVADGAPLLGIHDLVNRRTASGVPFTPAESLTVEQALRAYTIGSAYAAGEERHKGTLSRGKLADFVVLGDDLFAVAPERIKDVAVLATVVGGAFVFDAAGLSA
ncbi:UNVERIFIED_ORG: hypothetical protein FHR35_000219 [Microbispora rosea subsp. rosea]